MYLIFFAICSASAMRAVKLNDYGPPENMFIDNNATLPVLQREDDVIIRVHATAVNRADTIQRKGGYPPPKGESGILGLEASGVVEKLGANVTEFSVGDRVMALLGGGGYAEYACVNKHHVMRIPNQMSFDEAAAIPEVWLTAYQLLHMVGNLQENDRVLIHAAGSGVGTAAVQLVKLIPGCQVIATAGTQAKLEKAKRFGADFTVNYKTEDFSAVVKKVTGGVGVNLVLDPVGGSYWQKNIDSLCVDGRWVLYGLMGGANVEGSILRALLKKRIQLTGSTLRTRSLEYKGKLVQQFAANALPLFVSNKLYPVIDSVTSLDDVVQAHNRMEANENSGKIVMKVFVEKEEKHEL